jgi:hypothetical protein
MIITSDINTDNSPLVKRANNELDHECPDTTEYTNQSVIFGLEIC